ncbi:hypothetical protein MKUB_57080 [Mycobacterium kubicae]|uniref:Lipoprotein n=1 Tax=Mycobacterium kubicae TaxID=120959 RepID=A0AAX1J6J1_9MYCO|nr:hypothetical protein [Mycobacterium kubicae]MCV7093974.1 hypothetical protein [Mycobacterium kubicae]ORV95394.1 hypothetical protein AWC13_20860 [Mycobacterium kubicae]QPI35954.1 hypothetical protein I2456_15305 [Mycobacterium kubicae]GFG68218.1 hypothetical protein MKUB_57080 [Mycobacterium kubicae]
MLKWHKRPVHAQFTGAILLLTLVSGCSSSPLATAPPTIEPAHAAVSPPVTQRPAGSVQPLDGHPEQAQFDAGTAALVVLTPGPDPAAPAAITVLAKAPAAPRVTPLPGPASALTCDGRGTAYVAGRGAYFRVELPTGRVEQVTVAGAEHAEFTAIARRADGKLVLGSADGAVYLLGGDARSIAHRDELLARVDALVTQGNTAVALDGGQTSVTTIGADGHAGQALRAGEGATTLAADPLGRVLVADTRGGNLLVYGVDPLLLRQAYPVRQAPYGLAGSRTLVWVSQTASNIVIGYDLTTGIPVEKVHYPTVQQPNSLAYDDASDTLYVVSGSGAGVQVIEHAAGNR